MRSEEWRAATGELRERERERERERRVEYQVLRLSGTCKLSCPDLFLYTSKLSGCWSDPHYYAPTDNLRHLTRWIISWWSFRASDLPRYPGMDRVGVLGDTMTSDVTLHVTRRHNNLRRLTASLTNDLENTTTAAVLCFELGE